MLNVKAMNEKDQIKEYIEGQENGKAAYLFLENEAECVDKNGRDINARLIGSYLVIDDKIKVNPFPGHILNGFEESEASYSGGIRNGLVRDIGMEILGKEYDNVRVSSISPKIGKNDKYLFVVDLKVDTKYAK